MDGFRLTDGGWAFASATLAAVLAALAGTGCGGVTRTGVAGAATGKGGTGSAVALVRRAARATLAGSVGVEFELRGASAFGPSRAPVLGSGEFDFPAARGSAKIDLGESGKAEPGNEQALFLSERVYLQPKGLGTSVLPSGREWVSADLAGSEAVSTNFPSFALQVEGIDPQLALAELAGGAVAARPVESGAAGSELVGGVPARRYLVTVDLAHALAALSEVGGLGGLGGTRSGALAQAIQTELASPSGSAPAGPGAAQTAIEAWLGPEGRVAQLRYSSAGAGTATMTLCCYGAAVRVAAPPAGRVVDISALTPSGERENNGGGDSDGG